MKKIIQFTILAILVVTTVGAKTFAEKKEECWRHNKSPYCDGIISDNGLTFLENSKACEDNDPIGCYQVGVVYARGTKQVKKDMKLARKYYVKSCELGNTRMCVFVSRMYLKKAILEYEEGCKKGLERGCKGVDFAKRKIGAINIKQKTETVIKNGVKTVTKTVSKNRGKETVTKTVTKL